MTPRALMCMYCITCICRFINEIYQGFGFLPKNNEGKACFNLIGLRLKRKEIKKYLIFFNKEIKVR